MNNYHRFFYQLRTLSLVVFVMKKFTHRIMPYCYAHMLPYANKHNSGHFYRLKLAKIGYALQFLFLICY